MILKKKASNSIRVPLEDKYRQCGTPYSPHSQTYSSKFVHNKGEMFYASIGISPLRQRTEKYKQTNSSFGQV